MKQWREMTVKQLKSELKTRNVSQSGNKDELVKKLEGRCKNLQLSRQALYQTLN